jgi:hypothetical protein
MAKTINWSPSEASPSKGRPKTSTSIVTPPKKVKKGKSKIAVKKKFRKTPSSLSKRQSSSSSLSFSSSSLPASSSSSSNSLPADLPVTTAQSCSNQTTPPTKKKNDAYLQLSLRLKTDNFEVSSKIKLQHYEIDWLNPEVICSECIKYLKSKDTLPNNHANQLKFLLEKFEPAQIKISFSNAIGKIGNTATKLYYPLPMRKDRIVSNFIQLILSTMMYSRRRTAM